MHLLSEDTQQPALPLELWHANLPAQLCMHSKLLRSRLKHTSVCRDDCVKKRWAVLTDQAITFSRAEKSSQKKVWNFHHRCTVQPENAVQKRTCRVLHSRYMVLYLSYKHSKQSLVRILIAILPAMFSIILQCLAEQLPCTCVSTGESKLHHTSHSLT